MDTLSSIDSVVLTFVVVWLNPVLTPSSVMLVMISAKMEDFLIVAENTFKILKLIPFIEHIA